MFYKDEEVFCQNSRASHEVAKNRYIKKFPAEKCTICSKPDSLQLDHINGQNTDHRLNNLRWLCGNCHTQTPTYARQKSVFTEKVGKQNRQEIQREQRLGNRWNKTWTDDELDLATQKSKSYYEITKNLGLSYSGQIIRVLKENILRLSISTKHFTGKAPPTRTFEEVFCYGSTVSSSCLRNRYLKLDVVYECVKCKNSSHNAKPLLLHLDHINGDNTDNRLENLRWLCLNCDMLNPTWKGRNTFRRSKKND